MVYGLETLAAEDVEIRNEYMRERFGDKVGGIM